MPEPVGGFTPHLSLAYSDTDGPDEPYAAALAEMPPRSVTVEFRTVRLIALRRKEHLYCWETAAMAPLGLHMEIADANRS